MMFKSLSFKPAKRPLSARSTRRRVMVDTQKSKVYQSERMAFPDLFVPEWDTLEPMKAYLKAAVESDYYRSQGGWKRIGINLNNRCKGHYDPGNRRIQMAPLFASRYVLVHELTHALIDKLYGAYDVPSHGRFFCHHYLHMVRDLLGHEDAKMLETSFKANGVDYQV